MKSLRYQQNNLLKTEETRVRSNYQPPGTTRTRSPAVSGKPSSLVINFLISVAAGSVTFSVTVGAVVADISFLSLLNYFRFLFCFCTLVFDFCSLIKNILAISFCYL